MDDKLQIQRMAFEEAGMGGEWKGLKSLVPTTKNANGEAELFGGLKGVDFKTEVSRG